MRREPSARTETAGAGGGGATASTGRAGSTLIGEAVLKMFGLAGDELTARRFRRWLMQLVGEHLSVP